MSPNKFSVRESLQKCSRTSFSEGKFTKETWNIRLHEHEDRDIFVQVLNRGVGFHGRCLRARNWVFLYTRNKRREEVSGSVTPPIKITMRALGVV